MTKTIFLALCAASVATIGLAQQSGIQFHQGSWAEALQRAKTEQKFIFVDCYTTWCGPCKRLAAEVFPDEKVGEFYNKHFINLKLDMENDSDGVALKKEYTINAYPTLLYFTPEGEVVHRAFASDAAGIIETGHDAMNPQKQVYTIQRQMDAHRNDPDWLLDYMATASNADIDLSEPLSLYTAITTEKDWMKMKTWSKLEKVSLPFDSDIYAFAAHHRKELKLKDKSHVLFYAQFTYILSKARCSEEERETVRETIRHALEDGKTEEHALAEFEMVWLMAQQTR